MESDRYPTDLKEEEWALIAGLFTKSEKRGKKPNNDMRRIVDGCFYLLRGGIAWRMMPHNLQGRRMAFSFNPMPIGRLRRFPATAPDWLACVRRTFGTTARHAGRR